jgi:hypothetical protein
LEDLLFIGGELTGELLPDDNESSLHEIDDDESRSLVSKNKKFILRLVVGNSIEKSFLNIIN